MSKILQKDQVYSFRSYFEMSYDTDIILGEFGYTLKNDRLKLPYTETEIIELPSLQQEIETNLKITVLGSETSRREAIVAPILFAIARFCNCQIRLEYPLNVSNWLRGNLDYLLIAKQTLLVVEAKKDDMSKGFTQMAVELIALAEETKQSILYGAVTIGEVWRFGLLDSDRKIIIQDISLMTIPDQLDKLFRVIVGILQIKDI